MQAIYPLINQYLSGSAIADHITDKHSRERLHRLQFFSPKNSAVGAKNSPQRGF
ncbi:hypothetical protein [Nostoc sp.]|uniref:hypothetical protein n=1 Tax=Nostoc sp. TaxID=1180 RepID=UPI002FF7D0CC